MTQRSLLLACSLLLTTACADESGGDAATGADGSTGMDGGTADGSTPLDGAGMDGTTPGDDGSTGMDGAADFDAFIPDAAIADGGVRLDGGGICYMAVCERAVWACGNCVDDDMDGLLDSEDPDCVGACDNSEDAYELRIPGSDTPNCNLDCYYDGDQGSGNDRCVWDSRCDPLAPEDPLCPFTGPGMGVQCPDPQAEACHMNCDAITPNGCDCFGCCELPPLSGRYVFLGSRADDGAPPCSAATAENPASCHPCTPVTDCLNTCLRCELCLGRTVDDLDCDCFDPAFLPDRCRPDSGTPPGDAGPPPDGGFPPRDAGSFDAGPPPPPRCPSGVQACGLPGDPVCPAGYFCQTGCCAFFG